MLDETRINKMMEAEAAGVTPVTDAEIREFFEKNPDKFKQPEAVRASHILIRFQPGDEAAQKKALALIQSVHKQAKAGKDFGDLARKYSADGSAQQRRGSRFLHEGPHGAGVRECRLRAQTGADQRYRPDLVRLSRDQADGAAPRREHSTRAGHRAGAPAT